MPKTAIWYLNATNLPHQQRFLLKPICTFVGKKKLTADMGNHLQPFGAPQVGAANLPFSWDSQKQPV
jgi:hypothetical protein